MKVTSGACLQHVSVCMTGELESVLNDLSVRSLRSRAHASAHPSSANCKVRVLVREVWMDSGNLYRVCDDVCVCVCECMWVWVWQFWTGNKHAHSQVLGVCPCWTLFSRTLKHALTHTNSRTQKGVQSHSHSFSHSIERTLALSHSLTFILM